MESFSAENADLPEDEPTWPTRFYLSVSTYIATLLRPYSSHIISLSVFVLCIPIASIVSGFAGWTVWRTAAVGWKTPLYFQYGDGLQPYAIAELPSLVPQQQYDFSLSLVVPALESNYQLGNFMTTLTLTNSKNKTLAHVRRPAIALPPRSRSRFLFFLPSDSRTVDVTIPLLASHATGVSKVIATLELGRRDAWRNIGNGEGKELSVLSATLRGNVVHKGIRGLVTRFPLTSSIISSAIFMTILSTILAACIIPLSFGSEQSDKGKLKAEPYPVPTLPSTKEDEAFSELRSPRRKRSRQKSAEVKMESDEETSLPPYTSIGRSQLRRRRSGGVDTDIAVKESDSD